MRNSKNTHQQKLSERLELKKEIADTKEKIDIEEAKDIMAMDMGRLGWLENHLEVLRNRLNGTLVPSKETMFNYEIAV